MENILQDKIVSDKKTGNGFFRFVLGLNIVYYVLFVLQVIGFLILGVGGYIFSILINFSFLPLIVPLISIIALIIFFFTWKRFINHGWIIAILAYSVLAGTVFSVISNSLAGSAGPSNYGYETGQVIIPIIGLVLSIVAYKIYRKETQLA